MGEPVYDVRLLSETGGSVPASIGMSVATDPFGHAKFDTLLMGGGDKPPTQGLINFVRRGSRALPADRRDLHRRLPPRRGGSARRPARDDALEPRANCSLVSQK